MEHLRSHDRLEPYTVSDPLILGGAYHDGLAVYFSGKSIVDATLYAEQRYRDRYAEQEAFILPEERPFIERQVNWLNNSLVEFSKHYANSDIRVLQPEVVFLIPLPDTTHHCFFFHKILHPEDITLVNGVEVLSPNFDKCTDPRCHQPHWFKGKTDAVVAWENAVWLFEHKTEARTGDTYFSKYLLDFQPTGYLYGIHRSLGIRPRGFILNIIKKPNANFKGDPATVVGFEREAYLRSDEDLARFERELVEQCNDYEAAFRNPLKIYMNTESCMKWNRKCDYHNVCTNHGDINPALFREKPALDYVEKAYYEVLGLPVPETQESEPINVED